MEPEFWRERWRSGVLGWHSEEVHPDLVRFEVDFLGDAPRRVLVPLCGKTVDLGWLRQRGHHAIGVDVVEDAVHAVTNDLGVTAEKTELPPFRLHRAERLELLCGDFFALRDIHVGSIDCVWDRAALVAIDPSARDSYVETLCAVAQGARLLLNVFHYDQSVMDGPPWSVHPDEVARLFAGRRIDELGARDGIDDLPRWRERGHRFWNVITYLIEL